MSRRLWRSGRLFYLIGFASLCSIMLALSEAVAEPPALPSHPLTGPIVQPSGKWIGRVPVSKSLSILVMAGHADSQGMAGAGTAGEAVGLTGAAPMDPTMRDELFWNIKVRDAVVKLGKEKGLNISAYDPGIRRILDENDPRTNWSVGAHHARTGGYPLEIHFDAYGKDGYGSGLIPPFSSKLNQVDESLAKSFGRFPRLFRGGLGGPKRSIRILEIGKLEGRLEAKLRKESSSQETVQAIAIRIINALESGLGR